MTSPAAAGPQSRRRRVGWSSMVRRALPRLDTSPAIVLNTSCHQRLNEASTHAFRDKGRTVWWRRVVLPGIYPYLLTVTAAGACWNASIVAEVVNWGDVTVEAHGLGACIAHWTAAGDLARVVLGIAVMSRFVALSNRLLWRPLADLAERRWQLD